MSSNGFEIPIRLDRKPSYYQLGFSVITHCLALVASIYSSGLPLIVKLVLIILIGISFVYQARAIITNLPVWVCYKNGEWLLQSESGSEVWQLVAVQSVTPWFATFQLRNSANRKIDVLVVRDQVDDQTYRRLRVYLKLAQVEAAIPGDTI